MAVARQTPCLIRLCHHGNEKALQRGSNPEPQGHALRPRVPHAPQVDPERQFASRTHVRLGRTLGSRERERVRLHKWATGGEGAATRIVNSCAVNTKSDRQQAQACDGHGPQCMSLRSNYVLGANLFWQFWQVDIWRQLRNARAAAAQRFLGAGQERNDFVTRPVHDGSTSSRLQTIAIAIACL